MGFPTKKKHNDGRLKLRLGFGLVEADASGRAAIGVLLLILMLFGAGRWYGLL